MSALRRISDEEYEARPSKSELKRRVEALQALGRELAEVVPNRLRTICEELDLPKDLLTALLDYQTITKHEARRRKMQLIGKLMRDVDPAPLRQALDGLYEPAREEVEQHHRVEALRDDLLDGGPPALARVVEQYPDAEPQKLGQLVRNAIKERAAQKPPKNYRQLFRYLKELDSAVR